MKTWEYCQVKSNELGQVWLEGTRLERLSEISILGVLNELGKNGWELVSATCDNNHEVYTLKRES